MQPGLSQSHNLLTAFYTCISILLEIRQRRFTQRMEGWRMEAHIWRMMRHDFESSFVLRMAYGEWRMAQ